MRDLVLVHGWAMHGGIFGPLADRLASRFRIHAPDLPGHGARSDAAVPEDLSGWAEAMLERAPEEALWLGWSLGGLVAIAAALKHPERVRGLILIASSPRLLRGEDWAHGADPALLDGLAAGLAEDLPGTIERFLALEALGSGRSLHELRFLRAHVGVRGSPSPSALSRGLALLRSTDLRAALPGLAAPSLWIAGDNDRVVAAPAVEAGARCAGGRFVRIPRAGHAPFLTRPEEVAASIIDWAGSG